MAEITRLVAVEGKPGVRAYLDGRFWATLPASVVVDERLTVGEDLSDARRVQIEQLVLAEKALSYAIKSLDFKMCSRARMAERLARKGYPEATALQTLDRLEQLGVLDDDALALDRVRALCDQGRTQVAARQYLRKHGFTEPSIVQALERGYADFDPEETAMRLLASRPSIAADQRRAYNFLARRGFGPDIAGPVSARCAPAPAEDHSAKRPVSEVDVVELRRQLDRRFPDRASDAAQARKAWAWLGRRDVRGDQARALIAG